MEKMVFFSFFSTNINTFANFFIQMLVCKIKIVSQYILFKLLIFLLVPLVWFDNLMVMVMVLKLDTIDIIEVVPGLGNTILEYILYIYI